MKERDLSIAIMHEGMLDKAGKLVTTSITPIDLHDLARSSKTYGVKELFIVHPSPALRRLAHQIQDHWETGFGAEYNPDRKEAFTLLRLATELDDVIHQISSQTGTLPLLVATSARHGVDRISFEECRDNLLPGDRPVLLLLGTGGGMGTALLERTDYTLAPICGPTDYNHLSVRSACAIILDRLLGC